MRAERAWRRGERSKNGGEQIVHGGEERRAMHGGVSTEGGMSEDGGARSNEEGGTIELSTYHK